LKKMQKVRGRLGPLGGHIASTVVAFLLTPFLLKISGQLANVIDGYNQVILIVAFLGVLALGVIDFFRASEGDEDHLVLLYLVVILSFAAFSYFLDTAEKSTNIPILLALIFLVATRIVIGQRATTSVPEQSEPQAGFASAGVLLVKDGSRKPYFVLVHNKNLRKGLGLWVPPGGHVDPSVERPDVRLCAKITEETGYLCEVVNLNRSLMPEDQSRWESKACVWLVPPAFLLREDLMGVCSKGHAVHIDLCYVCLSSGEIRNETPKYRGTSLLEVDAVSCLESYTVAQTAITSAIDELHRRSEDLPQGVHDDLTQDIVWRLHLTARHLAGNGMLENGKK